MSTPTTTEPVLDQRAADYLDEVRNHLADLPADERDDLLEDLESHVHEVATNTDGPLDDVLGTPATFAAELRASAGLAPTAGRRPATLDRLRGRTDALRRHPWTRAVVAFLPELRPAWWVARGWLLVWLAAQATGGDASSFPLPELWGNAFVGLVATVPLVGWSVRLGRNPAPPRWRWAVNAGAVLGALLMLDAAGDSDAPARYITVDSPVPSFAPNGDPVILWRADGSPVTDLYAYGPDGLITDDVTILDQDGRPIDVGRDPGPSLPPEPRPGTGPETTDSSTPTTSSTTIAPAPAPAPAPSTVPGS